MARFRPRPPVSPLENLLEHCSYSLDLLSAIHIVADAWKTLTTGTIHPCFRNARFVAGVESDAEMQEPAPELPATMPDVSGDELIEDL